MYPCPTIFPVAKTLVGDSHDVDPCEGLAIVLPYTWQQCQHSANFGRFLRWYFSVVGTMNDFGLVRAMLNDQVVLEHTEAFCEALGRLFERDEDHYREAILPYVQSFGPLSLSVDTQDLNARLWHWSRLFGMDVPIELVFREPKVTAQEQWFEMVPLRIVSLTSPEALSVRAAVVERLPYLRRLRGVFLHHHAIKVLRQRNMVIDELGLNYGQVDAKSLKMLFDVVPEGGRLRLDDVCVTSKALERIFEHFGHVQLHGVTTSRKATRSVVRDKCFVTTHLSIKQHRMWSKTLDFTWRHFMDVEPVLEHIEVDVLDEHHNMLVNAAQRGSLDKLQSLIVHRVAARYVLDDVLKHASNLQTVIIGGQVHPDFVGV